MQKDPYTPQRKLLLLKLLAISSVIVGVSLVVSAGNSNALAQALEKQVIEQESLLLYSRSGAVHKITIELAISHAQQQKGLMFRTKIPENHGMLFLYKTPQVVKMWMKDTFIPLDMLFIDHDGKIVKIVERTRPMSLRVIDSSVKVIAVLEIAGGSAQRLAITRGDQIEYHALRKSWRK